MLLALGFFGPGNKIEVDRHFAEFFAGDHAITNGLRLMGYSGKEFDVRIDSRHDILTPVGFLTAVAAILSICLGGLCWFAPPCSTWVWMSSHSTGRNVDVSGKQWVPNVVRQNVLVSRLVYLVALCWHRGVHFIIEQPSSSKMFEFPRMKKLLAKLEKLGCTIGDATVQLGCFNLEMEKELVLKGWAPQLATMSRKMSQMERYFMVNSGNRPTMAYHWTENGKKKTRGGPDLKPSQSYPQGFGCHHALAFAESAGVPTDRFPSPKELDLADDTESDSDIPDEDPALEDIKHNIPELFTGKSQLDKEMSVVLK